jgi:hypothetical protein
MDKNVFSGAHYFVLVDRNRTNRKNEKWKYIDQQHSLMLYYSKYKCDFPYWIVNHPVEEMSFIAVTTS